MFLLWLIRRVIVRIMKHSPACSFHRWFVGSESFSYPWCFAGVETKVTVSHVEKCLSEGERGSAAFDLVLQPSNTQTQSCIRSFTRTHISLSRCGDVVDSFNWQAVRMKSWCCGDVRRWGVEVLSSLLVQQGQKWQNFPAAAVVRKTSLVSCIRHTERDRKVTQTSLMSHHIKKETWGGTKSIQYSYCVTKRKGQCDLWC